MARMMAFLSVCVAIAGAATFLWYERDLSRARDAARGARVMQTAVGPIEYAALGQGAPLLSIHGAGGGFDQGVALAAGLIGDEYRVIAPSRFGYLGTPIPKDISPAAQADAHAALLATLEVEKAVVVAASAGARSAVELALRHPEKVEALVLLVPGTYAPDSPVAVDASRGSQFAFRLVNAGADFIWWTLEKLAPDMLIRFIGVPPEVVAAAPRPEQDAVMRMVESIEPLSRRFPGINIDSTPDLHRLPLETIKAPTLIISARDDLFNTLPAATFAAGLIPGAKLVVFETGGHLLVGHQEEVRGLVRDFLAARSDIGK
jgi:pimeloyl-ACP methyl ester carboxylesterase